MRTIPYFILAIWLTSCPPDLVVAPAFVTVDGFELTTAGNEGAASTAVTEVWAFADEEFIGVYPLPARIPLLRVGEVNLRLEAGIRQDGRSATPEIYPFYSPAVLDIVAESARTISLGTLAIRYRPEAIFGFIEDFEVSRERVFTERILGNTDIIVQESIVRSGAAAGAIAFTDSSRIAEFATNRAFTDLNRVPINVWLEVDYLSEVPAIFGVIGQRNGRIVRVFDPGFLPRSEWTKIYFNLGPVIGEADLPELRVIISGLLSDDLLAGTVYLDNLKMLYLRP